MNEAVIESLVMYYQEDRSAFDLPLDDYQRGAELLQSVKEAEREMEDRENYIDIDPMGLVTLIGGILDKLTKEDIAELGKRLD